MTATYVTVVLDRYDGAGNPLVSGGGTFTPSQEFPDPADQMLIGMSPIPFSFRSGSLPSVDIIANDTAGPQGESSPGWTWNIAYSSNTPGSPAAASYYILSANGATQYLSDLAAVPAAQPGQQYVPWPAIPPEADQVLGWDGEETEWVDQSGGGGGSGTVTSVTGESANGFTVGVVDTTTTPEISVGTSVTGLLKGNGTAVSAATAGADYVTPTGSGAALTGITAAQVGADASGAAATAQSNAETFATSAVGTETTRAEGAEGTLSTAISTETSRAETAEALKAPLASPALTGAPTAPTASALTDSTQLATTAYADSAVAVETGRAETAEALKAPLASPALTGSPTAPTQTTGDSSTKIATDAFVTTAVATETTRAETAEALALPLAGGTMSGAIAMGSHKVTGLTNGSASSDAAAFGQIPAALPPNGAAGGVLSGTYPNPGYATTPLPESGGTMTGKLSPTVTTVAFASTVTLPVTTNVLSLTLTGACTVNAPSSGGNDGDLLRVRIIGANTYAVTWGTGWNWGTVGAPALAGPRDRIVAEYVASATVWDASADLGH